jgi:integrase
MSKSTKRSAKKPAKPYADFPLFAHATRRWAKKIKGKLHYFGPWDDPDGALKNYLDQRDDLHAGRTPRARTNGLTIRELCNRFLTSKRHLLDNGEITDRTFHDYYSTCDRIVATFGRNRPVEELAAADFERLRAKLAKKRGPVALGNEIQRVRMVFKYAYGEGLIDRPICYGQSFKKPSRKTLRKARAKNGKRMFEAAELREAIDSAPQPLRAMILLGINCGFGQTDVSSLPQSAVDLEGGWIDYPRPKTGIERRCPLWSETVKALREAIVKRPKPKDAADADLAFITKYGKRWVKTHTTENGSGTPADALGQQFSKLLTELEIKRPGVSFYALRHTFETIGGECRDQVAVDHIMGHARDDMASLYRERISDERLRAVTDTIHDWLFADETK